MSRALISRSPDLARLQNEGYEIEVRGAHLLLHAVPYVNSQREIKKGILVAPLTLNGDVTLPPGNHQAWFIGEHPCDQHGVEIQPIKHSSGQLPLGDDIVANHGFSALRPGGYPDFYEKMTQYVRIISAPAQVILPQVSAQTYRVIEDTESTSVFLYRNTAVARAGIGKLAEKFEGQKIAIVGLGGTGSYVLDLVVKTSVKEIHLFDGDIFYQHNAFRAPGAASIETLNAAAMKVDYFAELYGKMRTGLVPHPGYLEEETVHQLSQFDFVFICVDRPSVRGMIVAFLVANKKAFIDVGMEVELVQEESALIGQCRVTLGTPERSDHFARRVTLEDRPADDLYASNIQVAELNSLNASLAVLKWKKYVGFYQDLVAEHDSVYAVNTHQLTKDEKS
jgi:Dinucleotide-utilizing enzymes involved in molybdopterin and thiamine biosynthesis family 1